MDRDIGASNYILCSIRRAVHMQNTMRSANFQWNCMKVIKAVLSTYPMQVTYSMHVTYCSSSVDGTLLHFNLLMLYKLVSNIELRQADADHAQRAAYSVQRTARSVL
jgi:hypothetical protein